MRRCDDNMVCAPNKSKKLIVGLIIIFIGMVFLLDNLNFLPSHATDIIISWPMLLIAIGLINLSGRNSYFAGMIMIVIGGFFLIPRMVDFPFNFTSLFWPTLLIAIGLLIIFRRNIGLKAHMHAHANFVNQSDSVENSIDEVNIFGGSKRNIVTQNFTGGRITSIFGGSDLDFSNAQLAEGTSVLDMVCIFGGASIIIPSDWRVRTEVVSILGGFADKRHNIPSPASNNKELVIKGVAIFGGGEIKSFREV